MSHSGRSRGAVEIEATYRVVTPLFCAGTDPNRPEVRLPSFKGVLRYWWRALAWGRCGGKLEAIREAEGALFGSASGGQSRVSMRLELNPEPTPLNVGSVLTVSQGNSHVVGEGARYLGYGVMEAFGRNRGKLTRSCLRAPFDFTVRMRGRRLTEQQLASLTDALIALGTLGCMGAKSRKGYGSLALRTLRVDGVDRWTRPHSTGDLRDAIARLRGEHGGARLPTLPPFTALSQGTRHVLLTDGKKEPIELLDLIGREMVRYRSWGHNGRVLGSPSEKNFKDDHDLMKQGASRREKHPRRIAFGLPHNYGKLDQQVGPADKSLDRRASPLFIHIHQCDYTPVAVVSFFPAHFLPEGKSDISVGGKEIRQAPEKKLYRPIHEFLDRLLDPKKRKERFTQVEEVSP